jgi:protein-tyrosine phosphatase/membrane-associated phospholipid phosphatase
VRVSRLKAIAVSAGLSILFMIVYGGCNWITGQRPHVGSFYFQWERAIPFVPFLILPYMSIDLFFVGAPFLAQTNEELRTFSRRITAAILTAGICFLLFPLRFAFPRPHAEGWLGAIFDWFRAMDAPFNLLPSLHAALLLLLVDLYARKLRGVFLVTTMFWFLLVGLSPVLTYQHHVADIIGGFMLAGYCFYFFRERSPKLPVIVNRRLGMYYGASAAALVFFVPVFWPWSVLLFWPAIAFGLMGSAYWGVGPGIFRKAEGRLPRSTRFALAPCLLGQYLSLLYYRRQCRLWDEVAPRIWIGGKLGRRAANDALRAGVTAVLDLSSEFSEAQPFRAINYRNIPILDLTAPTQAQLSQMADYIDNQSRSGIVYVHCKIGYSRSAAAIAAYLLASGKANSAADAFAIIRAARPSIVIRREIIVALSEFEQHICDSARVGPEPFLLASTPGSPS